MARNLVCPGRGGGGKRGGGGPRGKGPSRPSDVKWALKEQSDSVGGAGGHGEGRVRALWPKGRLESRLRCRNRRQGTNKPSCSESRLIWK